MTSQLNVDTIVDKAGSGGTNVKIGNTSTYVSDGGNVTQNTVQGLLKVWLNMAANGASIDDSFNIASVTDNGTGDNTYTFSSNMASENFAAVGIIAQNNALLARLERLEKVALGDLKSKDLASIELP